MTHPTLALGELVRITSGFAFNSQQFNDEGNGLPLIRIRDVVRGSTNTYYSGKYKQDFLVDNGDALIGMDGEFNLSCWKGGKALLNQRVCKVQAIDPRLDQGYLLRFLPSALKHIEDQTPFVTVKHLSVKDLREIAVPLLPIAEQRRIAAILDKADALRAKRREAIAKLDQLLQSVFLHRFGDPLTNRKYRPLAKLIDVCERIVDCPHSTPRWTQSGVVCLRTSNLGKGEWSWADTRYVAEDEYLERSARAEIAAGDIIISREGTIGVLAIVEPGMRLCMGQRLVQLRADSQKTTPHFLMHLLLHDLAPERIARLMAGSTSKHLNVRELKDLAVSIPPLPAQQEFSEFARKIEHQKRVLRASAVHQEVLFASLQHRAFSGTL